MDRRGQTANYLLRLQTRKPKTCRKPSEISESRKNLKGGCLNGWAKVSEHGQRARVRSRANGI